MSRTVAFLHRQALCQRLLTAAATPAFTGMRLTPEPPHAQPILSVAPLILACTLTCTLHGLAAAGETRQTDPAAIDRGYQIYHEGRLANGTALEALRPGLPPMQGAAAACVQCHRPSGLGDQEGRLRVPPITAAALLRPGQVTRQGRAAPGVVIKAGRLEARPAYTPASLLRTLHTGLDPAGQPLEPWMPRYALAKPALDDLLAYLNHLGPVQPRPIRGIESAVVHVATVITPDAPVERQEAVRTLLSAWAQRQHFGDRSLQLHVWTLTGQASQWGEQLQRLSQQQPVYAILSGAGGAQWEPVERFCETQAMPCLFPIVDQLPGSADLSERPQRHFSVYFSEGPTGEARVAARALTQLHTAPQRIEVWFDSDVGASAAKEFTAVLSNLPEAQTLPAPSLRDWRQAAADTSPPAAPGTLVVSWLSNAVLAPWLQQQSPDTSAGPFTLWLSGHLNPVESLTIEPTWRPHVRWASLRADPVRFQAAATTGLHSWLRLLDLPASQATPLNGDVYSASFFFADAVLRNQGQWSVEYLLERLENGVNNRAAGGGYARLSLGQNQRIAAQVGQIQGYTAPNYLRVVPLSGFISAHR